MRAGDVPRGDDANPPDRTLAADCCRGNGPGDRSGRFLPRIKSVARAPDHRPVRLKPGDQAEHRFCQPSAKRRELVLNAGRHLCVDVTREHAVTLQVAHGGGEHPLGYPRNAALQIREPPSKRRPAFENEDHQQAPLVPDAAQHVSKVAVVVAVFLRDPLRSLRHRVVLPSCLRRPTVLSRRYRTHTQYTFVTTWRRLNSGPVGSLHVTNAGKSAVLRARRWYRILSEYLIVTIKRKEPNHDHPLLDTPSPPVRRPQSRAGGSLSWRSGSRRLPLQRCSCSPAD